MASSWVRPMPLNEREVIVTLKSMTQDSFERHPIRELRLSDTCPTITIGRSSTREESLNSTRSNALFNNAVLSRNHAELSWDADAQLMFVKDTDSLHGTTLNQQKLKPNIKYKLSGGDNLVLGAPVPRIERTYPASSLSVGIRPGPSSSMISNNDKGRVFTVPDDSDMDFSDSESDMYGFSDQGDGGVEHSAQVVQQLNVLPPQAVPATSSSQLDFSDSIDLTSDDIPITPVRAVPNSAHPNDQPLSATINQAKQVWIESEDGFLPGPSVLPEPSRGETSSSPLNFDASSSAFEFAKLQKGGSIPDPPLIVQVANSELEELEQTLSAPTRDAAACEAVPEQRGVKRKLFHISPEDASAEKSLALSSDLQSSTKRPQNLLDENAAEPAAESNRIDEKVTTFAASEKSPSDVAIPPTDHSSTKPPDKPLTDSMIREDIYQTIDRQDIVASRARKIREPRKRVRRVAEAMGFAALGGVAVMSALIATAPAL